MIQCEIEKVASKATSILYITHYYRRNIASTISTNETISGLLSMGYTVVLVTNDQHPNSSERDLYSSGFLKIYRVGGWIPWYITEESRFLKFLRATIGYLAVLVVGIQICKMERISFVFSEHHSYHLATLVGSLLSSIFNIPNIIRIHDVVPWSPHLFEQLNMSFINTLNHYIFKRASFVLVLSRELKDFIMKSFDVSESRILIFPNTIQKHKLFFESARVERMRHKLGLDKYKVLLFIGRTEGRGLELLLKSLPQIVLKHDKIMVLLVGRAPDRRKLERLAKILNVEHKIRFIGEVDHSLVPVFIGLSDICIGPLISSPLTFGAIPRKVLEYLAYGKAIIAARGSTSQDLLIDDYNAILVNPEDEEGLSSTIIDLFSNEKKLKLLEKNARLHVLQFYDLTLYIERLNQILQKLSRSREQW